MPKVSVIMPARIKSADESQWMIEAIDSVRAQSEPDWELIIVDDHSTVWPEIAPDSRIEVFRSNGNVEGTAASRNMAAEFAQSDLLLPLDADDRLATFALDKFIGAWKGEGFVYSSVMMFGLDWTRRFVAPEYSFYELLKNVPCIVGSLHKKSDWERVGGWKTALEGGFEDWEYWIALGELGVCGIPIPDVCYWYRRKANGRLGHLLQEHKNVQIAYSKMRELHLDSYNGRFPLGCCGGKRAAIPVQPQAGSAQSFQSIENAVLVQYIGLKAGSFGVRGNRTGTRYTVPGMNALVLQPNGLVGVAAEDVPFFLSLGRGADFRLYESPK